MNGQFNLNDPLDYGELPGWQEPVIRASAVEAKSNKWNAIASGIGSCFAALFVLQLVVSHMAPNMHGHRARSLDTASASSGVVALAIGYLVWRKKSNG